MPINTRTRRSEESYPADFPSVGATQSRLVVRCLQRGDGAGRRIREAIAVGSKSLTRSGRSRSGYSVRVFVSRGGHYRFRFSQVVGGSEWV